LQGILTTDSRASAVSLCLLVCSQPDSRPAESTLHTPINKTSSMILHSDQISYPKRNPRWIIVTFSSNLVIFMFYLPNKRRRCHLDVARCGRKVYQIYFWRHQPPAFVTTISKANYCSKTRK
jgi:hypothetical protein